MQPTIVRSLLPASSSSPEHLFSRSFSKTDKAMALNYFVSRVFIQATNDHRAAILPASPSSPEPLRARRRELLYNASLVSISAAFSTSTIPIPFSAAASSRNEFSELPNSGGVKALDLRIGSGDVPVDGDQVAIHYYGRLAAKQGWRFDSTYDHKDDTNEPIPFVFVLGSGKVISGIEIAVKSMKVGGIRRVIIPPSQGYQNTSQEPIPPNFFDRQRLFTTIFNPTRLANGEDSTLGTLIFDIELLSLRHK